MQPSADSEGTEVTKTSETLVQRGTVFMLKPKGVHKCSQGAATTFLSFSHLDSVCHIKDDVH